MPTNDKTDRASGSTPGRPAENGSRQQTHPDRTSQSGSPTFDKEATERSRQKPSSRSTSRSRVAAAGVSSTLSRRVSKWPSRYRRPSLRIRRL